MLSTLPESMRNLAAFAALFDHTLLRPDATPAQVRQLCQEARELGCKTVCVNPCYIPLAARELRDSAVMPIAVVGFPLGCNRTDVKIDEALRAIADGARELDMVINSGYYLGGETAACRHDIASVVRIAGKVPVKVIIETALLNPVQIREISLWCAEAGASMVKTSTGFGARGASLSDVQAIRAGLARHPDVGIKASGGIRTLASAIEFAAAGVDRIGSSATVQILSDFRKLLAETAPRKSPV